MNLEQLKVKLASIAPNEGMLNRWMIKIKNNPLSQSKVVEWAKQKKDKKNVVGEFHKALFSVKKPEPVVEVANTRFARLEAQRKLREN
jgi:hypothetical protein